MQNWCTRDHIPCHASTLPPLKHLGVLKPQQESKWTSPSSIIPKRDGSVHWISNLPQLNKVIKWKQYHLLSIMDILCKCIGHNFFMKLELQKISLVIISYAYEHQWCNMNGYSVNFSLNFICCCCIRYFFGTRNLGLEFWLVESID